jgi:hypothetical protein
MSLQEKAFVAKKSGQVAGPKPSHLRLKHHFYIEQAGADVQDGDS